MPRIGAEALEHVVARSEVPFWLPWPMPAGWLVSGAAYAGDERTGARATVLACSGPAPLGGAADLLLIAEEPGVGLGARYAGLPAADPGDVAAEPPHAKVEACGHPTPMWHLPSPNDCAAYVGEARGCWLWSVLWPSAAGVLLLENLALLDLRDERPELEYGAPSPLLAGALD